eukprot:TRINITY_DN1508_c1_g1_i10.p1 TRINITY_DN1508_c1_g1~~TRINITY_DN1508_c1_g1_i10.p1  ORF type:complete len:514 (-),score=178.36 TRINITY_DN1508_c1_g1_i10:17-1363(-)
MAFVNSVPLRLSASSASAFTCGRHGAATAPASRGPARAPPSPIARAVSRMSAAPTDVPAIDDTPLVGRTADAVIPPGTVPRREMLAALTAAVAATAAAAAAGGVPEALAAPAVMTKPSWEQVPLTADSTLFDMSFSPTDPKHGWLVGSRGTVLETNDGGDSWKARAFQNLDADDEINYRFEVVTFRGDEGWVIGKPSLLIHTRDGGVSWERVPLSPKLPGDPVLITALEKEKAEMTTTAGAVYLTENGGRNWKALVKETIDATLNRTISSGVSGASYYTGTIISVLRDAQGSYLAVSSRGNFFLTWSPGQDFWVPHGRDSSRRIQAMGFVRDDVNQGIWMSTRGGGLQMSASGPDLTASETLPFAKADVKSGGYGILDVSYRPGTNEVWAALGGGALYVSKDGGKSFKPDKSVGKIGTNLYKIKFFSKDVAFALGASGVLLRYNPQAV